MTWNFDMTESPKGYMKDITVKVKDKTVKRQVFQPQKFIAAGRGDFVTVSAWVPPIKAVPGKNKAIPGRWAMFGTNETPMAWMPWPDHPEVIT